MKERKKSWEFNAKQIDLRLFFNEETMEFVLEIKSDLPKIAASSSKRFTLKEATSVKTEFEALTEEINKKIADARKQLDVVFAVPSSKRVEGELYKQLVNTRPLRGLIYGHTGSGKTAAVLDYFEKGDFDVFYIVAFSSGMEDIDLLARYVPAEDGKLIIRESTLSKAFEDAKSGKRVGVLLDEINRAPAKTLNIVLKILDDVEGRYVLRNFVTNTEVSAKTENLTFLATANLGGYAGTFQLDEALFDRFSHIIYADYDSEIESEIIKKYFSSHEPEDILAKIEILRDFYKDLIINSPFSTRMLINWGKEVERGKNLEEGAKSTFVYRLCDVDRCGFPNPGQIDSILKVLKEVTNANKKDWKNNNI